METSPRVDDLIALPDGRALAYAEYGDPTGRPVLFFHATPGYRRNPWTSDAELRSGGVRLIAPDRPGVGASTPKPGRRLLDWPGALRQLGTPGWYYPAARRAPFVLRGLYAALAALARRDPRRAERPLVGSMSDPDRRLFARPEFAGRFGADLAGAGSRGVVDDERLMPLLWGFEPEQVTGPVRLWLGEYDKLVPPRAWLERPGGFPNCEVTVVPGAGHFFIAERMAEI